jgi:hypothetical protein
MTLAELTAARDAAADRFAVSRATLIAEMIELYTLHEVLNSPVAGGSGFTSNFKDVNEVAELLQHNTCPAPRRNLSDEIRESIAALVATLDRAA